MVKYVIPARAGSKRYPYKNRYLFDYTAKSIPDKERENVIVTTDDPQIMEVSKMYNIRNRPADLCCDYASMKMVLMDVATSFCMMPDDIIILLYLTYPQRTWKDIEMAYLYYTEKNGKSLLCRKQVKTHPYMCVYENGIPVVRHYLYRCQDYPLAYEISHYIGIFKVLELKDLNMNLYNDRTLFYDIGAVVDVDYQKDLDLL